MDISDENPDIASSEPNNSEKKKLKWKELEIPSDLVSEGLVCLEILENGNDKEIVAPKPKKRKKVNKSDSKKTDPAQEVDNTFDENEVIKSTRDWSNIAKDFTIPSTVLNNLYKNNLKSPTPIQKLAFKPSILEKNDILISSETGSGKTLCFVLPIVISLYTQRTENKIECLALLPTRELAIQVKKIFFLIIEGLNLRVLALIGGISIQKQERLLKKDPSIVVATPGRLEDFLREGKLKGMFELKFLVLDEVDKFFEDNSFKEVESIVKYVKRPKIQHFLSSATILNMKDNLNSLFKLLSINNPKVCICTRDKQLVVPYTELANGKILHKKSFTDTHTSLPENLVFKVIESEEKYKEVRLISYLVEHLCNTENKKCLIFVNTVTYVYRLESLLSLILWKDVHESGIKKKYCATFNVDTKLDYVSGIHSRLKQKQRLKRLESFSKNKKSILISTDVASRGLDIPNIDIVVHFHPPKNKSLFLHRSGRTARLNAGGVSVCVCCPSDKEIWKNLLNEINKNFEQMEFVEEIPSDEFMKYKSLLKLAETIEQNEFRMSKEKKMSNWFKNAARKADIMLSDEEEDEDNMRSRSYKFMKSEKKKLLKIRSEFGIDN
ncbi:ATP-dependent RNA helicase [Theileria orientalis]|uniref:ATP-dependent RNA helicase n=1 Tax=Theileria orientalis TaxID=68886 RepID=A0A976XJ10_THEOR|nr:ATP-dependent RNA helicase [Theileria orientalis]